MTRNSSSSNSASASAAMVESILQSDVFINKIAQVVSEAVEKQLTALVTRYEEKLLEKTKEIEDLKLQLSERCDELEQYQRRNCLRIFGKGEEEGEDTDCIAIEVAKKIGVQLDLTDIDRSHRVGRKVDGRTRPIIVKFVSYRKRREVFNAKKQLKNTGVTIREDLTRMRLDLLRDAISRFGEKNVWTSDGFVIAKVNNKKIRISSQTDLHRIV